MPPIAPPAAAKPAPQSGGGGGAPLGSSPAVSPTPNRGGEAAAMQVVHSALQLLTHALGQAGATSELGKKIHKAMGSLMDIAPPGSGSAAGQKNVMDQAQMRAAQQNQMAQQMRQKMMQQGQGGGAPGGAPGAGGGGMPAAA